jgi:hypothetical protein
MFSLFKFSEYVKSHFEFLHCATLLGVKLRIRRSGPPNRILTVHVRIQHNRGYAKPRLHDRRILDLLAHLRRIPDSSHFRIPEGIQTTHPMFALAFHRPIHLTTCFIRLLVPPLCVEWYYGVLFLRFPMEGMNPKGTKHHCLPHAVRL